jgi:eukaryotic-like serine/threonine-protein kinase
MPLSSGSRLGPYEIVAPLGAGGMGEVYRARDAKLNRDVALKVLPDAFAADPDRLARFKREAQVLASLNHSHIAAIYGLEDSGSTHALVLELVEGPTLADRIAEEATARGGGALRGLETDAALAIAKQIAEALEAAHEQGVVHRDLKPANIKVRADGTVKILDFGLAKALEPASAMNAGQTNSPTITSPSMTRMGVILGTAAYMSPEQARGGTVDKRADLWAFGVVLYEMLTGARTFEGATISDTLAAVLKTEPDWTRLPAGTPAPVRRLLRRCLAKDRHGRLADAADARLDLEDAIANPAADAAAPHPYRRTVSLRVAVPVGIAAVVAGAMLGVWLRPPAAPQAQSRVARAALPLSPGTELGDGPSVTISPDGTQVAYVATRSGVPELYLRPMDGLQARVIRDTRGATAPFFSPDGQWLVFFADRKLKKASTTGGVVVTLADMAAANPGGDWGLNDTIVFRTVQGGLVAIPAAGGQVNTLLTPEQLAPVLIRSVQLLPGGETLLVASAPRIARRADEASIEALTIRTGQRKTLVSGTSHARYLPSGHLVFLRAGTLMAVPLDLTRMELSGTPVEVMSGVRQQLFTGVGAFSCSRGGTCVYVAGGTAASRTVAIVDRSGVARPLPLPPKSYSHPRFSPAGDKLSWWLEQWNCDIEVYDIARGTVARLTSDSDNHFPIWTPDGQRITYITSKAGSEGYEIVSRPTNGGGSEEPLPGSPRNLPAIAPLSWSPAGVLAFADRGRLWMLSSEGEPRPFDTSKFDETSPAFSPDGRWLAYVSDESGRVEVYVRPVPGPGEKYLISTAGGSQPVWARSGRELFFRNGEQMMVVDIGTKPAFSASRPRLLFTGAFIGRPDYDVSPDGQSFVMVNSGEDDRAATQISVVFNWLEELKQRVPVTSINLEGR